MRKKLSTVYHPKLGGYNPLYLDTTLCGTTPPADRDATARSAVTAVSSDASGDGLATSMASSGTAEAQSFSDRARSIADRSDLFIRMYGGGRGRRAW